MVDDECNWGLKLGKLWLNKNKNKTIKHFKYLLPSVHSSSYKTIIIVYLPIFKDLFCIILTVFESIFNFQTF